MKSSYPIKTYRLNTKTIKNLEKIKKELGVSYNMLFTRFINKYNKDGKNKV